MKNLAFVSLLSLSSFMSVGLVSAQTAQTAQPMAAGATVVVEPVRKSWPTVREASGNWGVIGEATADNRGRQPVELRAITFAIDGAFNRQLLQETFDTPEVLAQIAMIYAPDSSGSMRTRRPEGTLTLQPGDTAVVYLAGLVDPRSLPRRARVSMTFSNGQVRRITIPVDDFDPGQRLQFPLRVGVGGEPWYAFNTAGTAHHWLEGTLATNRGIFISQRYAIDLVQIDEAQETHPTGATAKELYYAWNEDVLSAGRGRVVAAVDGQRDLEINENPSLDAHPAGNHVVVRYGRDLYGVYAHLRQGSVTVVEGQWVEPGEPLGAVGNSGASTQPHLHVHFTERWAGSDDPLRDFYISQGLPAAFWGAVVQRDDRLFRLRGTTPLEADLIVAAATGR